MQKLLLITRIQGKIFQERDEVHFFHIIRPFGTLSLWSLFVNQAAGVENCTLLEVPMFSPLYFDDELLPIVSGTGKVEDGTALVYRFAGMLVFVVYQIHDVFPPTEHAIEEVNQ